MALLASCEGAKPPLEQDKDLEDGEIEDDGDEDIAPEVVAPPAFTEVPPPATSAEKCPVSDVGRSDRPPDRGDIRRDRPERDRRRHEDRKRHMTEAEKSILHLRKRERMQREKWEKMRKEQMMDSTDDFAINIEKAIANALKKDKQISGDEDKEEDKKGRKRKNKDKERAKNKQRRMESPRSDDVDDSEFLNMRCGSPSDSQDQIESQQPQQQHMLQQPPFQLQQQQRLVDDSSKKSGSSPSRSGDSYESDYSAEEDRNNRMEEHRDRKREFKKNNKNKNRKYRDRSKERRAEQQMKEGQEVCVFFLQGKCQKNDCPYSHEAVPPMKLELCKFYLMNCCAKGEKCSYMHSEFPCKFYHTGLPCLQGDNCKFAHGKPLSEGLKQILFKHIETAPRDILGGFPRMSREEALDMINVTQQSLIGKYGSVEMNGSMYEIAANAGLSLELGGDDCKNKEKSSRNRPSRWQDPDPIDGASSGTNPTDLAANFGLKPFSYGHDQDMRINSNGDVDMRTLPPLAAMSQPPPTTSSTVAAAAEGPNKDIDIRNTTLLSFSESKDVDIRHQTMDPRLLATKDVDIRHLPGVFDHDGGDEEPKLQIDDGRGDSSSLGVPASLPKTQRDLFLRIQAQQKENLAEAPQPGAFEIDDNINWYSDDDDDDENRLTIKVEDDKDKDEEGDGMISIMSPPQIKPLDMVEKLGDLSKIDISAEVTKLLTSISQTAKDSTGSSTSTTKPISRDPRQVTLADPRRNRPESTEDRDQIGKKLSIYEQGSIDKDKDEGDGSSPTDFRSGGRPDVDLRSLHLPFKGMLNYTPAKEIDASVNSHPPIPWKVMIVEVPRPDYTGLKLSVQEAEKTGDPRLRKIFRLSTDEKDSPASPKASPKSVPSTRIDPRLKKIEEAKQQDNASASILSYNQQLNILQSSAFFQSLTSNQKLLLNQELSSRNDQNGSHDPVLNSLLTNLNLIPSGNLNTSNMGTALSILASVNKLNPMLGNNPVVNPAILGQNPNLMNQMAQSIVQPGLLGAAPGIPNLGPEFPMNFDPRNGGLLGNAPPPFGNFGDGGNFGGGGPPGVGGGNFDDYYQQDGGNNFGHGRGDGGRGGFSRDRRRGRSNFNNRSNVGNRNNFRSRNNRTNRSHTPP